MPKIEQEKLAKIQQIKANYLAHLTQIFDRINEHWQLVQTPQDEELQEMVRLVHSLNGTSGTLGFMDLSDRARDLEFLLQRLQQGLESHDQVNERVISLIREFYVLTIKLLEKKKT